MGETMKVKMVKCKVCHEKVPYIDGYCPHCGYKLEYKQAKQ